VTLWYAESQRQYAQINLPNPRLLLACSARRILPTLLQTFRPVRRAIGIDKNTRNPLSSCHYSALVALYSVPDKLYSATEFPGFEKPPSSVIVIHTMR
jgi:hypothetical protein